MDWLRVVLVGALSLALSGISILCCYVFGTHLALGLEGQIYGALGAVADAIKALLPIVIAAALAANQRGRATAGAAMFLVFTAYSFTSELGLYALGRNSVASGVKAEKESYETIKAEREKIATRLKELGTQRTVEAVEADQAIEKRKTHWEKTQHCLEINGYYQTSFCNQISKLEAEHSIAKEAFDLRTSDRNYEAKLQGVDVAKAVSSVDPQSEALARFTGFQIQTIRDALAVLVAVVIELGSGLGLWVATAGMWRTRPAPEPSRIAEPVTKGLGKADQPLSVVEALPVEEKPKAFPARSRPRLITSRASPLLGSVAEILAEIMEPGSGRVELMELFSAYMEACQAKGREPIPANEFSSAVAVLCERLGIQIKDDGTGIYLLNVRLKASAKRELADQAS